MTNIEDNVEAMLQIVQQRLDTRVTDADELDRLKKGLAGVADRTRVLSDFKLPNADEPFSVFSAYRAEDL